MEEISTLLVVPKIESCNARCKFCVTQAIKNIPEYEKITEQKISLKKLKSVCKFSKRMGIIDANITGGTEPTLYSFSDLADITKILSEYFGRVNIYTNGARLILPKINLLKKLADSGLTNITISRAHYDDEKNKSAMGIDYDLEKIVKESEKRGIDLKLSCLLMKDYIHSDVDIKNYLDYAKKIGAGKVIFRELLSIETANDWTKKNYSSVNNVRDFLNSGKFKEFSGLWNQRIWDYNSIGVSFWPDGKRKDTVNNGDLIYMPDNHLYSRWDTKSSKIM